jgi:hypothetical protein
MDSNQMLEKLDAEEEKEEESMASGLTKKSQKKHSGH